MINEFVIYKKKVQNLSGGTVAEYAKNLHAFARWIQNYRPGVTWSSVTKQDIEAHMMSMADAGMKPRTIQLRVATIRSYYNYLRTQGMTSENPAKYVQLPKAGEQIPQTVNVAAIVHYVTKPATTVETVTMQALISILVETGMRIQEAMDIRTGDINKQEQSIIITGKGNKQRKVYYGDMTRKKMNALAQLVDTRRGFFHYTQWQLREMMTQELRGIVDYIHPHMLRHTFATTMLEGGAQLKYVSAALGHESVKTTERYTHVVNKAVETAVKTTAPRLEFKD